MASLADLGGVYETAQPAGFSLADMSLQAGLGQQEADLGRSRILRNYSQFALPDLANGQASKGAYWSSATRNKGNRLAIGAGDELGDLELQSSKYQAGLASNALLAQTGIAL